MRGLTTYLKQLALVAMPEALDTLPRFQAIVVDDDSTPPDLLAKQMSAWADDPRTGDRPQAELVEKSQRMTHIDRSMLQSLEAARG